MSQNHSTVAPVTHGGHSPDDHHPSPRPWSRIKELFRPERGDIAIIVVYALFVALLSLAIPVAVEAMVTTVMFGVVIWPVIWLALVLLICLALAGIIHGAEAVVIEVLQRRLFVRTVSDFARKLPRVRFESYDREYGPDLANRFFDILNVQKSTATLLLDGISIILATFVGMIVLALYHPLLLVFDLGLIVSLIVIVLLGRGAVKTSVAESHAKYDVAAWLEEIARSPRAFKTGAGPVLALTRADQLTHEYVHGRRSHFHVVFRQFCAAIATQVIASVMLLGLGGWLVMNRQLTAGQLIASELIVTLVVGSLLKLNKYLESWYDLCTGVEKLAKVLDLPEERTNGEDLPESPGGIRVRVSELGYDGSRPLIEGLSWMATANEKLAFTGRAGTGKSVLLDVLAGLREPTSGTVELDGLDLRDLRLDSVRQQVAVVHETEIFSGTIADNLRLGREGIGAAAMRDALLAVNLLGTIQELPQGLDTPLTQTGHPLSASQALRLCIARAIIGKPRLMLIDGALDRLALPEAPALLEVLFAPSAPWTLLVVTRVNEIIDRCDRVIGLETSSTSE